MEAYQELKLKKAFKFIIFKLTDDFSAVVVDVKSTTGTYDDFVKALPKDGCRYAVFDFEYSTADGPRNKLLFYTW